MLKELIKLANHLDGLNHTKEADYLDGIIIGLTKRSGFNSLATDSESFGAAFRAARDSGAETFKWNNKEYSTQTRQEVKEEALIERDRNLPRTPSGSIFYYSSQEVDSEGYLKATFSMNQNAYKGEQGLSEAKRRCYEVGGVVGGGHIFYDEEDALKKIRRGCHSRALIANWTDSEG